MTFSSQSRKYVLIMGDIAVLYSALYITLMVRYGELPSLDRWSLHILPFTVIIAVFIIAFIVAGLYELSIARNNRRFLASLVQAIASSTAIAMVYFYVVRPGITPRLNLLIFVVLTALFITLWRRALNAVLGSTLLVRTMILGYTRDAFELARTLATNPQLGMRLVMVGLNPSEASHAKTLEAEGAPVQLLPPDELPGFIRSENIELVIPATDGHIPLTLVKTLYTENHYRVSVADLPAVFETATGKVPVQSISELWFLEHAGALAKPLFDAVKRAQDIALAFMTVLLALPLSPFIYAAIKLDSEGSGFFMQKRVGKNGRQFLAIKFRSMYWGKGNDGPLQVAKSDPRVTRVGRLLRKTRLDELPQLINILKGDMSFVGPRPEQPELVEQLSTAIPFYRERLQVKPGLTGWDQISGAYHSASVEDTLEKLQYDLYYIKHRSFVLDITILLRTIKTVLSAAGR